MQDARHRHQRHRLRLAYGSECQRLLFCLNPTPGVVGISNYRRRGCGLSGPPAGGEAGRAASNSTVSSGRSTQARLYTINGSASRPVTASIVLRCACA